MSRTIEEIKKDIERLKESIMVAEMGNDSYYLSRDYKEHKAAMYCLTLELKQAEQRKEKKCQK